MRPSTPVRTRLIIVGGGEHARVIAQLARSRPELWEVEGFVDREECREMAEAMDAPHLGNDETLPGLLQQDPARKVVLGVGSLGASDKRPRIVERLRIETERWANVIDSSAQVAAGVHLGHGVVVMPGALINCGASLGEHSVINTGAIIEHDVQVGAFVQVGPGAAIGGGAVLGRNCYIGLGARVRDHVTVESGATVGMGAVVVASVPGNVTVMGVPARIQKR